MLVDSPAEFARHTYDFIVIGGGTAGLTLAARLTEDPDVTVGVVEAGQNRLVDPNILVPGRDLNTLGNPDYDWQFVTTTQNFLNDRTVGYPRGKVLGGSSAINGMMCTYSSIRDIDNWEKLGNPGWSFEDLAPYYRKFEGFTTPSKSIEKFYETKRIIDKELHNADGPVKTSFPHDKRYAGDAWIETFDRLGLKMNVDPQTGKGLGGHTNLVTLDAASGTRSYSATAYFAPNVGRSNLTILTQAQDHSRHLLRATGVDFTSSGTSYHVRAGREVLLCAGTIQSPQVLELSGIGSKSILEPLGINVLYDNPNVGENLQDHPLVPISYQVAEGAITLDSLAIPGVEDAATSEFYATQSGILSSLINSNSNLSFYQVDAITGHIGVENMNAQFKAATEEAENPSFKKQYQLLQEALHSREDCTYQFIYIAAGANIGFIQGQGPVVPGSFITLYGALAHPFSRGTVHINSKDFTAPPLINPNYLSHPLDLPLLSNGALFMQELATRQPFASKLKDGGKAFRPGYHHLTKDNVKDFIKSAVTTEFHPAGTCAMMPEKEGGVVDTRLKVYGVENLRVIDASILPMMIRNNLQTSVYAVAERAADMIKEDWGFLTDVPTKNIQNGHIRIQFTLARQIKDTIKDCLLELSECLEGILLCHFTASEMRLRVSVTI
ncbi:GMC oxidoreductase [Xylogone sp. PMI_703]|nr:GMC oxidoreductase [Xylogone sp. PMI_703]